MGRVLRHTSTKTPNDDDGDDDDDDDNGTGRKRIPKGGRGVEREVGRQWAWRQQSVRESADRNDWWAVRVAFYTAVIVVQCEKSMVTHAQTHTRVARSHWPDFE